MDKINNTPLVSICSITYNHAPYIRQCLDGFLMQKTDFSVEVIINDDASTDGTTEFIREYEDKHPDIIKPIYHEENLYSKGQRGFFRKFCFPRAKGKYIAFCEGDDYWIDPLKLQKQVDFMEANPDYTMCCTNAVIQTPEGDEEWCRYPTDQTVPTEDVIKHGGLFVQTATLLFRREVLIEATDYPESAKKCHVGDFPLQIYAALKGKVYWFVDKTATYRYLSGNSWTVNFKKQDTAKKIRNMRSEIDMLKDMDLLSNGKYSNAFKRIQAKLIYYLFYDHPADYKLIEENFQDVFPCFNQKQRTDLFFMKRHCVWLVWLRKHSNPRKWIKKSKRIEQRF